MAASVSKCFRTSHDSFAIIPSQHISGIEVSCSNALNHGSKSEVKEWVPEFIVFGTPW